MNAHAGMPFCGVSRFAVPTAWSVFGLMTKGQQPFWGVGRLRLSCTGFAEPRLGKLQRSTPFLYPYKIGLVHYDFAGADSKEFNQGVNYDDHHG